MAGRNQWETVVAQASKEKMEVVMITADQPLAPDEFDQIELFALPNTLATIVSFGVWARPIVAATTGGHRVYMYYILPETPNVDLVEVYMPRGKELAYRFGRWEPQEGGTIQPAADVFAARPITYDESTPCGLGYRNLTDATITEPRRYAFTITYREITTF